MILLLPWDSLLILGGLWLTQKGGAAHIVYTPLKWQQVTLSSDSLSTWAPATEQHCISMARNPSKYQQINTNKCRSSSFPTPLPCSSGITWWDYCLELSDWFLLIYSWFSAKGIYRERWMLLLLTESKPQYITSHQTNQGLCFVITTSLPLTSNTKENYKLWNKPINQSYVNLKDFIRCISIRAK